MLNKLISIFLNFSPNFSSILWYFLTILPTPCMPLNSHSGIQSAFVFLSFLLSCFLFYIGHTRQSNYSWAHFFRLWSVDYSSLWLLTLLDWLQIIKVCLIWRGECALRRLFKIKNVCLAWCQGDTFFFSLVCNHVSKTIISKNTVPVLTDTCNFFLFW